MRRAQVIDASCSRRGLELEQVKRFLRGNGYVLSADDWRVDPRADLVLLSTCAFTEAAEDLAVQALKRIQRTAKPGARVVLGGCLPEINPSRVAREFEGPTFSPQSYARLNVILHADRALETFRRPNTFQRPSLLQDVHKAVELFKAFDGSPSGLVYIRRRLGNGLQKRLIRGRYANLRSEDTFYIQIQEGCSMRCSYCVIRKAIGLLRSKPLAVILDEFHSGLNEGFRRFQLMGDNAGSYGLDRGMHMGVLLAQLSSLEEEFYLDLTDINPVYLPQISAPLDELCVQGRLARLYVPIQSGSKRLLRLMNRDCNMDAVKELLLDIRRRASSDIKLGTSLIVGFPSETLEDVEETATFCLEVGFDWVWCHSFSARPETPAANLAGQIPAGEILQRARWLRAQLNGRALVTTAEDTEGSRTCQG